MSRRPVPGILRVALLFALLAMPAHAAEDSPSVEDLVQRSLASELKASRTADDAPLATSRALAGPVDPATYRLGPGDRLVVQWAGRVTRSEYVEVGPAGDLFLPEIGGMMVAGMTLADARLAILSRLQRVTRDVRVEVQLAHPRTFRVYRSGAVDSPGPVEAVGGSRVSDVVQRDGLQPGASTRSIELRHRDGTRESVDLERVFRNGDHGRDPWLRDGDAIVVPFVAEHVWVSGAVLVPGMLERAPDDSLGTLLRLAGGLRPEAAPEDAQWIHWTSAAAPETLTFDARAALAGRFDAPLAHGDRVFVRALPDHRRGAQVVLEGEVARPGGYPIAVTGTRLGAVLAAAGGLLATADPSGIRIRRLPTGPPRTDAEQAERARATQRELTVSEFEVQQAQAVARNGEIVVDWSAVQHSPRALDPLLQDDDVITVPTLVNTVRIEGQVARPGVLHFEPGTPLSRYVAQAGGYSARAWRGHEQVTRGGGDRTLLAKSAGGLKPGDVVWVPMRPEVSAWRRSAELLSALAQIATIIIAIRSVR
ncbi:MAG: SLBB domain-containing protein [Candidatus Eisenbacteria bacterium]